MRSKQTDGIGNDGDDVDLSFPSFLLNLSLFALSSSLSPEINRARNSRGGASPRPKRLQTPTRALPPLRPPLHRRQAFPRVALALGAAGAAPFLALAPQVEPHVPLLPDFVREHAAALQVGYGVAIASFLGGIHWGLAASGAAWQGGAGSAPPAPFPAVRPSKAATAARYLWSVVPCLLAWPATALVGAGKGDGKGKGAGDRTRPGRPGSPRPPSPPPQPPTPPSHPGACCLLI